MDDFTLLATKAALLRAGTSKTVFGKEAGVGEWLKPFLATAGLMGGGLAAWKALAPKEVPAPQEPEPQPPGSPTTAIPPAQARQPLWPSWKDKLQTTRLKLRSMLFQPLGNAASGLARAFHQKYIGGDPVQ